MKKNLTLLTLFIIVLPFFAYCQEDELKKSTENLKEVVKKDTTDGWKKGGAGNIGFSQVTLTNWAAGGQNTISVLNTLNLFANYKKGKSTFDNTLDIAFGIVKQGEDKFRKNDDRFEFNSKFGRKAFNKFYYAGLLNFRTQFAPGFNLPNDSVIISDLLAPAYLTIALGLDYKPNNKFTAFLSPVTGKITFVNNPTLANAGAFGVEPARRDDIGNMITPGKKVRYEFGGYFRMIYKTDLGKSDFGKNATFQTRLDLFSNYLNNPQNIDVNWETNLLIKVGKYIVLNFATLLIYDHDIMIGIDTNGDKTPDKSGPRTQFRQIFALGFSYKF